MEPGKIRKRELVVYFPFDIWSPVILQTRSNQWLGGVLLATITGQKSNEVKFVCHMSIMVNTLHECQIWQPRKDRNMRSQPEISFIFLHQTYQWLCHFLFLIAIVTISCQTLRVFKWHTRIVFTLKGVGVGPKEFFGSEVLV